MQDVGRVLILLSAIGGVCMVLWQFFTAADALADIARELKDMNYLTRARWGNDYKQGRMEKPTKVG